MNKSIFLVIAVVALMITSCTSKVRHFEYQINGQTYQDSSYSEPEVKKVGLKYTLSYTTADSNGYAVIESTAPITITKIVTK